MTDQVFTPEAILTTRDAARMLGVSVKTAQQWVESGRIGGWKTPGGHRRIFRSSVEALLSRTTDVDREAIAGPSRERAFRVVLIEDDLTLLDLYKHALDGLKGLELRPVDNCLTGLLRIGEQHPDLVVTDLRMQGFNGFQMINAIRNDEELRDTPITVITGMTDAEIEDHGGLPHGVFILRKPLSPALLRNFVGQAVSHATHENR